MVYQIILKLRADDIRELEDILDKYNVEYQIEEVFESEVK